VNPGLCDVKPATNCLRYEMAFPTLRKPDEFEEKCFNIKNTSNFENII
jgi:hypothetical protein